MRVVRVVCAVVLAVLGLAGIALGAYWVGLDRADKLASVVSVGIGAAGLALSWLALRADSTAASPSITVNGPVGKVMNGRRISIREERTSVYHEAAREADPERDDRS